MAVKIRLKRLGKIRQPHYRIVVADARTRRDGRVIEEIGKYHPKRDPSLIEVDSERAQYWLSVGAQPSEPVVAILRRTGDWQRFRGEPPPAEPLRTPEPRRDKTEVFNQALSQAHQESPAEGRRTRRAKPPAADAGEAPAADSSADVPADEPGDGKPAAGDA